MDPSNQPPTPSTPPEQGPNPVPPPTPVQPIPPAAPVNQIQPVTQIEGMTVNMTSVESKAGLYTKITFASLWVLVLAACSFITSLVVGGSDAGAAVVFFLSVAIIATPIFIIANQKRSRELAANPKLTEDVFVKKYLRSTLYTSIIFTAIAAFYFIWLLLSMLFLSEDSSSDNGKGIITALVFAIGSGSILAFCWPMHARTTK